MAHPSINQPQGLRAILHKRSVLVGGTAALIVIVIACVVAGWMWIRSVAVSYNQALPAYTQRAQDVFNALDGQQPPDTDAYRAYLETHANALRAVAQSTPERPRFLGLMAVGSDQTSREIGALTNAIKKLQAAMDEYRMFLVYRDSLLAIMQDNAGKVSTPDDMRVLKDKLEKNNKKLERLIPPRGLEKHLQEKIDIYEDIVADLNGALMAYDQGDTRAYRTHVAKFGEDVKRIDTRNVAAELLDNHTYYRNFDMAAQELAQLLDGKK